MLSLARFLCTSSNLNFPNITKQFQEYKRSLMCHRLIILRLDGLSKRISKDMELYEEYEGRDDCLIEMTVVFGNIEKKFGPADSTKVIFCHFVIIKHFLQCRLSALKKL